MAEYANQRSCLLHVLAPAAETNLLTGHAGLSFIAAQVPQNTTSVTNQQQARQTVAYTSYGDNITFSTRKHHHCWVVPFGWQQQWYSNQIVWTLPQIGMGTCC